MLQRLTNGQVRGFQADVGVKFFYVSIALLYRVLLVAVKFFRKNVAKKFAWNVESA